MMLYHSNKPAVVFAHDIDFFFHWLSLLMQWGGITEVLMLAKKLKNLHIPPCNFWLKLKQILIIFPPNELCVSSCVSSSHVSQSKWILDNWKEITMDFWKLSLIVSLFPHWHNVKIVASKTWARKMRSVIWVGYQPWSGNHFSPNMPLGTKDQTKASENRVENKNIRYKSICSLTLMIRSNNNWRNSSEDQYHQNITN